MSEFIINFTYKNPSSDFFASAGVYPSGKINPTYSLIAMRQKLQQNIEIINELIEHRTEIKSIHDAGNCNLSISLNAESTVGEKLLDKKIIRNSFENTTIEVPDPVETNQDRQRILSNLINTNNLCIVKENESELNGLEEPTYVEDKRNDNLILKKYEKLITKPDAIDDITIEEGSLEDSVERFVEDMIDEMNEDEIEMLDAHN